MRVDDESNFGSPALAFCANATLVEFAHDHSGDRARFVVDVLAEVPR